MTYFFPFGETVKRLVQYEAIDREYNPEIKTHGLNEVTIPRRPSIFCDAERCKEILAEIDESKAGMLVLLGDIPIKQFLNKVAKMDYSSLKEYTQLYGYGAITETLINNRSMKILPLAHPRQIGALGGHSATWFEAHQKWEK